MYIKLIEPTSPVADFSVSGTKVSFCGLEIDCAERQSDSSTLIEIRIKNGVIEETDQGAYLAQIHIPPRKYIETSGDESPEPLPLDPNSITVTLWPSV